MWEGEYLAQRETLSHVSQPGPSWNFVWDHSWLYTRSLATLATSSVIVTPHLFHMPPGGWRPALTGWDLRLYGSQNLACIWITWRHVTTQMAGLSYQRFWFNRSGVELQNLAFLIRSHVMLQLPVWGPPLKTYVVHYYLCPLKYRGTSLPWIGLWPLLVKSSPNAPRIFGITLCIRLCPGPKRYWPWGSYHVKFCWIFCVFELFLLNTQMKSNDCLTRHFSVSIESPCFVSDICSNQPLPSLVHTAASPGSSSWRCRFSCHVLKDLSWALLWNGTRRGDADNGCYLHSFLCSSPSECL